jgi:hypothetical protein
MHANHPAGPSSITLGSSNSFLPRHYLNKTIVIQSSALAMQEQERIANEEAEKRLKAALTAKREPTASRVASPSLGNSGVAEAIVDMKPRAEEAPTQEDVAMEVEQSASIPLMEVSHELTPGVMSIVHFSIESLDPGARCAVR